MSVCFALLSLSPAVTCFFLPVCACRLCSDGKKTFSSRAMLEKHMQLRHRIDVGTEDTLMVTRLSFSQLNASLLELVVKFVARYLCT